MLRIANLPVGRRLCLGVALLSLGCSAELEQYTTDAETGTTHALVTVERSSQMDGSERAGALASFVQLPAEADARLVLENVGLRLALPPLGQCRSGLGERPRYAGRVELVEAGNVSLWADSQLTNLAPHAFPTVTDVVSGVVYASRDVSADPFPVDQDYTLKVSGDLADFEVTRGAPSQLSAVAIGGVPLSDLDAVSVGQEIDLTWAVGSPSDIVWVELSGKSGTSTVCAFRDDLGFGTVPAGAVAHTGSGRLSLHRLRVLEFTAPGVTLGELRFDFELQSAINFVP